MRLVVLSGDTLTEVDVRVEGEQVLLDRDAVLAATGWTAADHGLCRGDLCRPAPLGTEVSLADVARLLDRPLAVEVMEHLAVAVLGEPGGTTTRRGDLAPPLTLSDADGDTVEVTRRGRRTLVVAWSTWCGCRYELPSWRALAEELEPLGLDLVAVALDDDADRVRHWTAKADLPAVLDPEHRLSDVFGVVNVPSTVWLDEDGRVAKPPTIAPGDDQFVSFTEIEATGHHQALREWMHGGEAPDVAIADADEALRTARAEHRLATWLRAHDHAVEAGHHLESAVALAPLDFSIRRASMRHRGEDPFGEEFFALWEEWSAAGRPGYQPT